MEYEWRCRWFRNDNLIFDGDRWLSDRKNLYKTFRRTKKIAIRDVGLLFRVESWSDVVVLIDIDVFNFFWLRHVRDASIFVIV